MDANLFIHTIIHFTTDVHENDLLITTIFRYSVLSLVVKVYNSLRHQPMTIFRISICWYQVFGVPPVPMEYSEPFTIILRAMFMVLNKSSPWIHWNISCETCMKKQIE